MTHRTDMERKHGLEILRSVLRIVFGIRVMQSALRMLEG